MSRRKYWLFGFRNRIRLILRKRENSIPLSFRFPSVSQAPIRMIGRSYDVADNWLFACSDSPVEMRRETAKRPNQEPLHSHCRLGALQYQESDSAAALYLAGTAVVCLCSGTLGEQSAPDLIQNSDRRFHSSSRARI